MRTSVTEIQNAAERAAALTRQLLAFGRRQTLESSPVNLNEVARDRIAVRHLFAISALGNLVTHALIFMTWIQPFNLPDAAFRGDIPRMRVSLALGADVNAGSPLHLAVLRGNVAAAKTLLDAGADVDALRDGKTPLALAVAQRPTRGNVIELLVERGASIDDTMLDAIAHSGDAELMRRVQRAVKQRGHPTKVGSNP